jgi:hypothetical protein
MSCKIERIESSEVFVVLRISGRIEAEDVPMIKELLGRENGRVAIDLKEVVLVAREAVDLLALSEANGVELRGCPSYIREWINQERSRPGVDPLDEEKEARHHVEDT